MQALYVVGEYRNFLEAGGDPDVTLSVFAELKVDSGEWIRDDGDHYTAEEWESQYEDEDFDCHCGHPECGAC